MRRVLPFVLAGLLAGCTDQLAARQAYLSQFIGQPESAVVQAMGVPTRNFETGGVTYLAYNEHRIDFIPGPPTFAPWYIRRLWRFSAPGRATELRDDVRGRRRQDPLVQTPGECVRLIKIVSVTVYIDLHQSQIYLFGASVFRP